MYLTPRTDIPRADVPGTDPGRRPGVISRLAHHVRRDERGLTLVELLISIVILGIISVPLGTALISFFQHSNETTNRLSVSHDAQIAASYFAQDVASVGRRDWTKAPFKLAQSIEVNVGPTTGVAGGCGPAGTPNAAIRLLWDEPTATGTPKVVRVSYVLKTVNGQQQLHRLKCNGDGVLVSDATLAHNVVSVDVACSTACTDNTVIPQTVTLTLHLRANGTTDALLDIPLTGQRRQT